MTTFTPATIYDALGSEPSDKKIMQLAAMMMRNAEEPVIYKNNISTLMYYIGVVQIAYNTGVFCNCFKNL